MTAPRDCRAPENTPEHQHSHEYIICPYCKAQYGDCWEWVKGEEPTPMKCDDCGRTFVYFAEYTVTYITEPGTAPPSPIAEPPHGQ